MSTAPYAVPSARTGARMGDAKMIDLMMYDGLWGAYDHGEMGEGSDKVNAKLGIGRTEQDEWSARSHERAAAGTKAGKRAEEIVTVEVPQRKGDPVRVEEDEGIRPGTTVESLSALKPAFSKEGTITAGNASQISDAGAALVVMPAEKAKSLGSEPLATIDAHGQVAGPDTALHLQPANATPQAQEKAA